MTVPQSITGEVAWRAEPRPQDRETVVRIVSATGFFTPAEVAVAVELVDARLAQGPASGYEFLFAEQDGRTIGYTCYGLIACTAGSYDLYWIAVEPGRQGRGLGRRLLVKTEQRIAAIGGTRVYIETSNRPQYAPTRAFYVRCGYGCEATLKDFYAPGDDKVIYVRPLNARSDV